MPNTIASTFVFSSILGAGWISNLGKAKKGLTGLGALINGINDEKKRLFKLDPAQSAKLADLAKSLGPLNSKWVAAKKSAGDLFVFLRNGIGISTALGGSIFALAKTTATYATQTSNTAKALGIGMGALQELRYSASQAGLTSDEFDTSLRTLNLSLGKAFTDSTSTAAGAIRNLGLDMGMLQAMPVDERFNYISDALSKVTDSTERATLASQIFGKSLGAKTGAWLGQGSSAIKNDRATSAATGSNLTESDAATATQFTKAFDELKATAAGLWRSIGMQALAPISGILKDITKYLGQNKQAVSAAFGTFFNFAKAALAPLKVFFHAFIGIVAIFGKAPALIYIAAYALGALGLAIAAVKINNFIGSVKNFSGELLSLAKSGKLAAAGQWALAAASKSGAIPAIKSFAASFLSGGWLDSLRTLGGSLMSKVGGAFISLGRAILGVIPIVWSFTASLLANPITWIVVGIVALVAGIILLWKNWSKVTAWMDAHPFLGGIIKALFPIIGLIKLVTDHFDEIKTAAAAVWDVLVTIFDWVSFKKPIDLFFNWLDKKFNIFSKISGFFKWIGEKMAPGSGTSMAQAYAAQASQPLAVKQQQVTSMAQAYAAQGAAIKAAAITNKTTSRQLQQTITVHAAPGQNADEIAEAVMRKTREQEEQAAHAQLGDLAYA